MHSRPKRAQSVAVATPCWPAPAAGEQDLAEHVVHLVRAGVVQLFALQVDLGAAEMVGQPLGEIERARPADIVREVAGHLGGIGGIGLRLGIGLLEVEDERHQRLGDEAAAIDAEAAAIIRAGAEGIGLQWRVHFAFRPQPAAAKATG
jgi:hypothetical protein